MLDFSSGQCSSFRPAFTAGPGDAAIDLCARVAPDVGLVDIDSPGIDGIETTLRLKEAFPSVPVVVISAHAHVDAITRAVAAGASGFVPKTSAAEDLFSVIGRAALGEMAVPEAGLAAIVGAAERRGGGAGQDTVEELTPRELQILQAVADGQTTQQIAKSIFLSPYTVQSHVKSILGKLRVSTKLAGVMEGLRRGLVVLDSAQDGPHT